MSLYGPVVKSVVLSLGSAKALNWDFLNMTNTDQAPKISPANSMINNRGFSANIGPVVKMSNMNTSWSSNNIEDLKLFLNIE